MFFFLLCLALCIPRILVVAGGDLTGSPALCRECVEGPSEKEVLRAVRLRHDLHRLPDISGDESRTALLVETALKQTNPDLLFGQLGGNGVAAVYFGKDIAGPKIMFRAELDGLPINETTTVSHRSTITGKAHMCGHDGHMAILFLVGQVVGRLRPTSGAVVLLFQPAEENGAGAQAVLQDPHFTETIIPDIVLSLHNLPGIPFGHAVLKDGPIACASRGMKISLLGTTSHAAYPHHGNSPILPMAQLLHALSSLGSGGSLQSNYTMVTITHVRLGEPSFGISPGEAYIYATLRTLTDTAMSQLVNQAEELVYTLGVGFAVSITYHDVFNQTYNSRDAVRLLQRALKAEGIPNESESSLVPMIPSEDFGLYAMVLRIPGAMLFLGPGKDHPQLHKSNYDFPDNLIKIGAGIFLQVIRQLMGC